MRSCEVSSCQLTLVARHPRSLGHRLGLERWLVEREHGDAWDPKSCLKRDHRTGAQAEDVVSARLAQQRLDILHLIVETVVLAVRAAHGAATTVRDIERELVRHRAGQREEVLGALSGTMQQHDAWPAAELAVADDGAVARGQRPRRGVRRGCAHESVTEVIRHVAPSVAWMPQVSRVRPWVLVFDRFLIQAWPSLRVSRVIHARTNVPTEAGEVNEGQVLMADKSTIEWTESTWNPTTGCDRTSPGCDHCYALTLSKRLKAMGQSKYQRDGDPRTSGPGFGLTLHPDALDLPHAWVTPRTIFVNSMSDLFHEDVPVEFIGRVLAVAADTPQHTYQILTKRSRRLRDISVKLEWPPNVWMGVSIENDRYTFRARHLREVHAAVRFLSLEPLLSSLPSLELHGIDWVIAGGESGPRARPLDEEWVRDVRDRCFAAAVPFFFKQWGGRTPKAGGRLLEGRTWDQMPELAPA